MVTTHNDHVLHVKHVRSMFEPLLIRPSSALEARDLIVAAGHGAGHSRRQVLLLGQGEDGAPAVLLRGQPIPAAACFCQLGVNVAIGDSRCTGPVLSKRREACCKRRAACCTSSPSTGRCGRSACW